MESAEQQELNEQRRDDPSNAMHLALISRLQRAMPVQSWARLSDVAAEILAPLAGNRPSGRTAISQACRRALSEIATDLEGIPPRCGVLEEVTALVDGLLAGRLRSDAVAFDAFCAFYDVFGIEASVIDRLLQAGGSRRVVEIGTGSGRTAFRLSNLGFEVDAVDRSAELIRVAEAIASAQGSAISFSIADALESDFYSTRSSSGAFSLLSSWALFSVDAHKRRSLLRSWSQAVPAGSTLVMIEPHGRSDYQELASAHLPDETRVMEGSYAEILHDLSEHWNVVLEIPDLSVPYTFPSRCVAVTALEASFTYWHHQSPTEGRPERIFASLARFERSGMVSFDECVGVCLLQRASG